MAIAPHPAAVVGAQNKAQDDAMTAFLQSQPWWIQQLQAWGNPQKLSDTQRKILLTLAQQHGVATGDHEIDDTGRVTVPGHYLRAALTGGAVAGGLMALPLALGGAGGAGAGAGGAAPAATTAGLGPSTAGNIAATTAATAPPSAIAAAPAATTGFSWSKLFSPDVLVPAAGAVSSIIGSKMQSDAAKEAAAQQQAAAEKALALQREIYERGVTNLAPYMNAGYGAVTNLRGLTGQPAVPTATANVPTLSNPTGGSASQTVQMRAPDGSVKAIPPDQVAHYQQLGAKVVS